MTREYKEYRKRCPEYEELTDIEIEFLVSESFEHSPSDYAKNRIVKCGCRDKFHCTRPRHECPVWIDAKW